MLKLERLRRGWNQTTLACHAGISVADLSRIETGRLRPYPRQADRLGAALHLAPSMLFDDIEVAESEATKLVEAMRARHDDEVEP
ncbi:MAG: helix-turn-helix transcriptional regulator [Gemmatimonadetes bacterium]|nr:helix-turn-helix transcriptional regulator [Gemmatimonadota bacterium]